MGHELKNAASKTSRENIEGLVLYNSPASPCARRVRITLLEKGLEFDTVEMNLATMEQRNEQYMSLNPNGYVPTLTHGEHVIYDSKVINEYLEEQFPSRPLMPRKSIDKALVRTWIAAEDDFSKVFRPLLYQNLMGPIQHISRTLDEARQINKIHTQDVNDLAWGDKVWQLKVLTPAEISQHQNYLLSWLDKLDEALENRLFIVGNRLSQADICLFPRIEMMSFLDFSLDKNRFANLLDWIARLSDRTAFKDSMSPKGKKLASLAKSKLMQKTRRVLAIEEKHRHPLDKLFIWGFGHLIRRLQNVDRQLLPIQSNRDLPLPRQGAVIQFKCPAIFSEQHNTSQILSLYGSYTQLETQKVMLSAQFLGLAYEHHQSLSDIPNELSKTSRLGAFPHVALVIDGVLIMGASVICEYLFDTFYLTRSWTSKNSFERAKVRMWLALEQGTNKEFDALFQVTSVTAVHAPLSSQEEERYIKRIQIKCSHLNQALKISRYLCGEQASFADLIWFSRIQQLLQIPAFSLAGHAALLAWYDAMLIKLKNMVKQESVMV